MAATAQEDTSVCIVPVTTPSATALCGRAEPLPPTPYAHTPWLPPVQGQPGHIYPRVSARYVTHSRAHYHYYSNVSHTSYNQPHYSTQSHLSPGYATQPHLSPSYSNLTHNDASSTHPDIDVLCSPNVQQSQALAITHGIVNGTAAPKAHSSPPPSTGGPVVSETISPAELALHVPLPFAQQVISTPLRPEAFHLFLSSHPDQALTSSLLSSLRFGFRLGYSGSRSNSCSPNLRSALEDPEAVDRALLKELAADRIAGPYLSPPLPNLRCSGLGLVPKGDGSSRLIFHLSAPSGHSINDGINPEEFSLSYHTIDDAIRILLSLGPGALMAKADLKNAFRLCPVHPLDWPLLAFRWRNRFFVDKCLPFGLRSAPFLFNMVADALQWILEAHFNVTNSFHYLDDFFFAGQHTDKACDKAFSDMIFLCERLGVPLKPEKLVRPTTQLTFLGIYLDSVAQKASLPSDKLDSLLDCLSHHLSLHHRAAHTSKRELLSLIGKLSFATKVVPAGRIFLRRLLDLAHSTDHLDAPLLPSSDAALDIQWWFTFARPWNGTAFFLDSAWSCADTLQLYTDASSEIGFGAFCNGRWFNGKWSPAQMAHSIEWKELYAIVMACEVWGHLWFRRRLLFHCDNQAIVHIWKSGLSRSSSLMHLVRALFFVAARGNFHVVVVHIPGIHNTIADALSRFHMQKFRAEAPSALPDPDPTPVTLTLDSALV